MSKKRGLAVACYALLACTLCVVLGAWICVILGHNVQNVLSAEGVRWLFMHALDDPLHLLPTTLLLLFAAGCLRRWWVPVAAMVVLLSLMLFPSGPLLSVTGNLWPSPFVRGIVPAWAVLVILISLFHAPRQATRFLPWLVPFTQGLFLFNLIQFIINP